MRVAVLSDIHGNRQAFEAVLAELGPRGIDETWCLGDLVGYGAEPEACVALAAEHCEVCLAGNHDLAVRGDIPIVEFSRGAALAVEWTREVLSEEAFEYLRALSPQLIVGDFGLFHASPRDPIWEYVLSTLLAELCLDAQPKPVSFVGHSHVALSFSRELGEATTGETREPGDVIDLASGEHLINPGSVGQPRDGDPRASWLELDTTERTATFHRTEYDIRAAQDAIRAARLPDSLAERLEYGQ